MDRELSDTDRQILEYIYRTFKGEGRWASSRHLVHDLRALGGDVYEIAKGIGWWLVRVEDPDSKEDTVAKLTIEGVAACEGSEQDLLDFVSVLRLFVRTYRATREGVPQVTTDDFMRELNLSELQARKMAMLVLEEGCLWRSAAYGATGRARFGLDRKILRFEKVDSIEDYLEIRERDRAPSPTAQEAPTAEPSPPLEGDPVAVYEALHLHPAICEATEKLFRSAFYNQAILEAFKRVNELVKAKSGRDDLDGKSLMGTVFSEKKPMLRFNPPTSTSARDEQEGFKLMAMGAMVGIRNPRAHETKWPEPEPLETLEYLAFASLLARQIDKAEKTEL